MITNTLIWRKAVHKFTSLLLVHSTNFSFQNYSTENVSTVVLYVVAWFYVRQLIALCVCVNSMIMSASAMASLAKSLVHERKKKTKRSSV